jgi:hypothetical protein
MTIPADTTTEMHTLVSFHSKGAQKWVELTGLGVCAVVLFAIIHGGWISLVGGGAGTALTFLGIFRARYHIKQWNRAVQTWAEAPFKKDCEEDDV